MAAVKADLNIYQGDSYAAVVSVLNEDMSAADLDGYTAQAQIRTDVADKAPEVVIDMVTAMESPNIVKLSIPHSQTATLEGRYAWDLQLVSPSGDITTVLAGKVLVTQEVTRA